MSDLNQERDEVLEETTPEASAEPVKAGLLQKLKKGKKKKWILPVVIVIVVIILVAALAGRGGSGNQGEVRWAQAVAGQQDIIVSIRGTGTIEPADSYRVLSLVRGDVLAAPFEEGQILEKDALLYQMDTKDVETSLEQAQLAVRQAQLNYDNVKDMVDDLNVKATGAGQVARLYCKVGDSVSAGQPVADIVDKSSMTLELNFLSVDAQQIRPGQSASVTISSTGEVLPATVESVSGYESVGLGGALIRSVKLQVPNPGGITDSMTATAAVGGFSCQNSGMFTYQAKRTVMAMASGDVISVPVAEGDWVTKDQVLVSLDSGSYDNQLEAAQISLENARLGLKNAQNALDNYTITSPIAGTVIEKNFKVGDTIDATSATTVMAVIYDLSSLTFDMSIDELDIRSVKVGQTVEITADAVPGVTFTGVVDKVSINGTTMGGVTSYPVTVKIPASEQLLPGMNVTAEILVEEARDVLAVPVSAVRRGNTVLVQREGAAGGGDIPAGFEEVVVELGRNDGNYIEILSGLQAGDVVSVDLMAGTSGNIVEEWMADMSDGGPYSSSEDAPNAGAAGGSPAGGGGMMP